MLDKLKNYLSKGVLYHRQKVVLGSDGKSVDCVWSSRGGLGRIASHRFCIASFSFLYRIVFVFVSRRFCFHLASFLFLYRVIFVSIISHCFNLSWRDFGLNLSFRQHTSPTAISKLTGPPGSFGRQNVVWDLDRKSWDWVSSNRGGSVWRQAIAIREILLCPYCPILSV